MQVRRLHAVRAALAIGSIGALALMTTASTAGAGIEEVIDAPLTIVKVVNGVAPAGTTFTATIQCSDNIIVVGGSDTDTATVTFDATGQPTSPDVIGFDDPGQCAVTETATGGASTVAYACTGVQGIPVDDVDPPVKEGFDAPSSSAVVIP